MLACLALSASLVSSKRKIWHLTDVHVDPWYVTGSDPTHCDCETYQTCPRVGPDCTTNGNAGPFGNAEANCASPHSLYTSAISFMQHQDSSPDFIFFTGDFCVGKSIHLYCNIHSTVESL